MLERLMKKIMGQSPTPDQVGQPVVPVEENDVFEASWPLTVNGREVKKIKYVDYDNQIRVVFDAESGETLGVLKI